MSLGIMDGTGPKNFWKNPRWLVTVYLIVGFVWCLQTVLAHAFSKTLYDCTFFTFRDAFFDLVQHLALYPGPANNVFKYSPTFALFFAPFALTPAGLGMFLWVIANFAAFFAAIWYLPLRSIDRAIMLWVSLFDLMTAIRDWQSNGIVVACIIGTFLFLHKGMPEAAACCVIAGFNIKIYGAAGGIFFLFYPQKFRFFVSTTVIGLVAFALPLLVISWSELLAQYRGWFLILHQDCGYLKRSVMGLVYVVTGWRMPMPWTELAGMIVMLLPLFRVGLYGQLWFRLRMLASILLGIVIFNHMADRPAFATAAAGAVLWYMLSERDFFRTGLLLLILVFSLKIVLHPDEIKVVPFAIIWIVLQCELWRQRADDAPPVGLESVPSGSAASTVTQ